MGSIGGSGDTVAKNEIPIFYRDPAGSNIFIGPFNEAKIQSWYREGFFHSQMEFRIGTEIYTLDNLRAVNGIACPFSFPIVLEKEDEMDKIFDRMQEEITVTRGEISIAQSEISTLRDERNYLLDKMEKVTDADMRMLGLSELLDRVQLLEQDRVEVVQKMTSELWSQKKEFEGLREADEEMQQRLVEFGAVQADMYNKYQKVEHDQVLANERLDKLGATQAAELEKFEYLIRKSSSDVRQILADCKKPAEVASGISVASKPLKQVTQQVTRNQATPNDKPKNQLNPCLWCKYDFDSMPVEQRRQSFYDEFFGRRVRSCYACSPKASDLDFSKLASSLNSLSKKRIGYLFPYKNEVCKMCNVMLQDPRALLAHLKGKKHKQLMRLSGMSVKTVQFFIDELSRKT